MTAVAGFANVHPFFVHAPLVLIPTAALMVWLGRKIRQEGFDTATLLVSVGAALAALVAMTSGFLTDGTFPHDRSLDELLRKHQINGVALTAVASVAALLAIAEWRRWIGGRVWWLRALLFTWAAVGVFFSGHNGAQLVYLHGAAVAPVSATARADR